MSLEIFSLNDKTVLITGASSGIGKAVAQQCAAAGASCIVTGRNKLRLEETLSSLDGEVHSMFLCDLTNSEDIENLVQSLSKVDGVVCCAGIVETKLLKFSDENDLRRLFDVNAISTITLISRLVKLKKLKRESSIAIVSSISGVKCGYIGGSIYGATKGALEGFIKGTALELAPQKIRVNTIVPGMVETALLKDSSIDEEQQKIDMQKFPLKRYGKPEEIGFAAVYLLSDATKWMTGSAIVIDGGYTIS